MLLKSKLFFFYILSPLLPFCRGQPIVKNNNFAISFSDNINPFLTSWKYETVKITFWIFLSVHWSVLPWRGAGGQCKEIYLAGKYNMQTCSQPFLTCYCLISKALFSHCLWQKRTMHCEKKVSDFPSAAGMSLTFFTV